MPFIIALGFLIIIAFCINLLFLKKEKPNIPYNRMQKLDVEIISKLICDICTKSKIADGGKGINPSSLMPKIRRTNSKIAKKIKKGEVIGEGAKWLYENFYLLYRYAYMRKDDLKTLPHINGVPRIVVIAKLIVNNSLLDLDSVKVRKILDVINERILLSYSELRQLNNALYYAMTEQAYILSKRISKQYFYENKAQEFNIKYLDSNVYVYNLFKKSTMNERQLHYLEKRGITRKKATVSYNNTMLYNSEVAKTVFTGMREVDSYVPSDLNIRYLGAYRILSQDFDLKKISVNTLKDYFSIISEIALSLGADEDYVAEKVVELAKKNNLDVSVVLFDYQREIKLAVKSDIVKQLKKREGIWKQRLYALSIILSAVGMSAVISVFFNLVCGILAFVPLFFIVENLANYALSFISKSKNPPEMNYSSVPHEQRTAVVVSEFVSSLKQFEESYRHLRLLRASNGGANIEFVLLVDTKGGDTAIGELDKEITEYVVKQGVEEDICVFLRRKTLINGKYSGFERKRGAINALNKLFVTGNKSEFLYISNENYFVPKNIVTLDSDNSLITGDILEMVNIISHPYNKKYDLLALHSRYDLYSLKTNYSLRFMNECGIEEYPVYSDLFYNAFGRDLYCGKGIYRLNAFYEQLEGIFPSGKILSHDIIEGSVLKTGGATTVLEDVPTGFLSDRERRKRWMRGDIQLLPFMNGTWLTDEKKRYKTTIEPIYKYIMGRNALSILNATFGFALLLFGLLTSVPALLFAIGVIFAPYIIDVIKILRGFASGVRLRYIVSDCIRKITSFIEDFFMLGYYAIDNLFVFLSTLIKMGRKKNLLNWKTYHDSQADNAFSAFVKEFAVSFTIITLLAVGLFFINPILSAIIGGYLFGAFAVYFELYLFSSAELSNETPSAVQKKKLLRYATKTYKYFNYMLSYGGLIGDNLQIKPYKGVSATTSPTNIGFALLAQICAFELDIIPLDEALRNMAVIISDIEKLPKWRGNLYNWYDINKKKQINSFVSSVDSGNLIASLIVAREFFALHGDGVNELKTELLIINTNLSALFDKNKNMFYIGFDGEKFVGHYDILNSESRILSTIYLAYEKDIKNFRCLQRDYSSLYGNTLLSWSGTAFETLMPALFIKTPRNSVLARTEKNVSRLQSETVTNGIWGTGESGYYAFDENLKYQYYAFGIRGLSLKNEETLGIVSPYSSAICLSYRMKKVIKNMERIESMGGVGEYGFYEAIDMRGQRKIVLSHMSHHQGMILCAITNFLKDNVLQTLFSNNEKIAATLKNFNELMPKLKIARYLNEKPPKSTISKANYSINIANIKEYFQTFALIDGNYSVVTNGFGGGFSKNDNIYINRFSGICEENHGAFFVLKDEENKVISPTFLPVANDDNYSVFATSDEVIFDNTTRGLSQKITLLNGINGEVRILNTKGFSGEVAFYSDIALNSLDAYISHPAYNGLFISATVHGNIVILKNRAREKDGKDFVVGMRVEGLTKLRFECNTENFIGRNGSLKNPIIFSDTKKTAPSVGDVLNPCMGFCGKLIGNSCEVAIIYGESEEEVLNLLNTLPDNLYSYALLSDGKYEKEPFTNEILGELLYVPYPASKLNSIIKNGQANDFMYRTQGKKVLLYKFLESNMKSFKRFLRSISDLQMLGISVKTCVEINDTVSEDVRNFIAKSFVENHILNAEIVGDKENIEKYAFLVINSDLSFRRTKLQFNKKFLLSNEESENYPASPLSVGAVLYRSGSGGFDENDSYIVDGKTALPYSNVIAGEKGGMITTDNGGGFFYFDNSRENKMNRFDNDQILDDFSEFLYVKTSEGCHRLNSGSGKNRFTVFERGKTVHVSKINGLICTLKYTTLCGGLARLITVDALNNGGYADFIYGLFPALSWRYDSQFITSSYFGDMFTVTNLFNGNKLHIRVISDKGRELSFCETERVPYFEYFSTDDATKFHIVFSSDENLIKSFNFQNIPFYEESDSAYFEGLGNVSLASRSRALNIITRWLPYQIVTSRVNGKLGFYQVGGANGFRDRLQDSLAILGFSPEKTREIIIDSAKHQYLEGDVMHWWHNPKFGLRTKITDDKLFLPLVVAEYVEYTGDYAILDMELPYLSSPVLQENEKTRYENPPYTEKRESLLKHCLKAIKSSLKFGEHGLLIMGSGDWNDGMDEICAMGKGESVFNSMLAYEVMKKIALYCNDEQKKELLRIREELKVAVNNFAFEKDRYMRLYSDSGVWLGAEGSEVLKLDLLTQSYAVISGIADEERAQIVLKTAESLIDREAGIIKLLSPPLKNKSGLGYISAYPEGVRENGGQYTHASIWYLIALTRVGRQDDAYDLFMMLNPVEKLRSDKNNERYKGEPYVLSGDVYSNGQNYGRMGWSWYTGSAGWAYKLIVEEFLGLKRKGKKLYINPHLPKKLSGTVVSYRYGESVYSIEYSSDNKFSVEMNGVELAEDYITLEQGTLKKVKVSVP